MIRFRGPAEAGDTRSELGPLTLLSLVVGILSLFLERYRIPYVQQIVNIADFALLAMVIVESIARARRYRTILDYLRENTFDVAFLLVFVPLFAWVKYQNLLGAVAAGAKVPAVVIVLRGFFVVLRISSRLRRLTAYTRRISTHPARTVAASFAVVIMSGTVFLMQPFTTADGEGLRLVDALFTSTSAVCVTGLIVVDTARAFTFWGRLVILVLIQVGGLGIMILSYFAAFAARRALSVEDKLLIAYMINETDARNLRSSLRQIVLATLAIEALGAALLFLGFRGGRPNLEAAFFAVFHAVSAFCNAGFALFSDSLEGFRSSPLLNVVVCLLIICGGLGFGVLANTGRVLLRRRDESGQRERLNLNSRVVLVGTAILIPLGMLLVYAVEHGNTLRPLELGSQYLAAFFQSVTLRTAGFNSIPMGALRPGTYLLMMAFMFVGAAAGSTAGGIKINAVAVVGAHLKAVLGDRRDVILFRHFVSPDLVTKALMIVVFGIVAVAAGGLILSLSEQGPTVQLLFEVVSAFGTVGLSAGVTGGLTLLGKLVIIVLMFMGRLGPLTLLAAAARRTRRVPVQYPHGDVVIG